MAKGDVVLVGLPASTTGREQAGTRPAVEVQTDDSSNLPTTVVVPFTGQSRATRFPHTLTIRPDGQNGLSMDSVLLVFQVRAIDRSRVHRVIGQLSDADYSRLETALVELLELDAD